MGETYMYICGGSSWPSDAELGLTLDLRKPKVTTIFNTL